MFDGPRDTDILDLSRQILSVEYEEKEPEDQWLKEQAQLLSKQKRVESIGMNQALEKT